jgi:hypothetical protein
MKKSITIGNQSFRSIAECERYTRSLLIETGVTTSVKQTNLETFEYLTKLGERHPNYEEKFQKFIDFEIRVPIMNKKGLALFIINDDKTLTEISWIICVSGKTTSTKDLFIASLRESIHPQISYYRATTDLSYCRICNCSLVDTILHIDHYEPQFSELVDNFLQMHNDLVFPMKYDKNKITYHTKFKEQDEWIGEEFAKYHLENATLRVLCESCNLKRPNAFLEKKGYKP